MQREGPSEVLLCVFYDGDLLRLNKSGRCMFRAVSRGGPAAAPH